MKKKNNLNFNYNWYFIRQDIVSYLIPTLLYLFLCVCRDFTLSSVVYGFFECLVFYVPFWYIRINFSNTYHSDSWKHCKMWTRIMLCTGVFTLFILPIHYSLFNGLFVAFVCCLILYLVALESDEKKRLIKENKTLESRINNLLNKYDNPKDKLLKLCEERGVSDRDTQIAVMYFIERKKPKQILEWLCENKENISIDSLYVIINRIDKKLNK